MQDGGIVTALLAALLEAGEIDGALVAKPSEREPWKGVAHLARAREELIACAGSFYNQTLALGHLDLKKYDLPKNPRIAARRHALRDPGAAGDAGAALLLGRFEGRRRRADRRPAVHQELRLRRVDAARDPGEAGDQAARHRQDRHHPRQAPPLRQCGGDASRRADPRFPRRGPQGLRRVRRLPGAGGRHLRRQRRQRRRLLQRRHLDQGGAGRPSSRWRRNWRSATSTSRKRSRS